MPPSPRRRLPRFLLAALLASTVLPGFPATTSAAGSRLLTFADDNTHGELGNGTADVGQPSPIELNGMADIVAVSSGVFHNLALRSDGRVLAWGDNTYGQLGDGTLQERHVPTLVPGLSHVVAIKAGGYFSVALRSDGSVWHWGGRTGQTAATSLPKLLSPERVADIAATTLGAGVLHRLVRLDDGTAAAFGYNEHGQLGDGTKADHWAPAPMAGASGVVEVAAGGGHSAVLLDDGTVLTTGLNDRGQLGNGTKTPRETLAPVADLEATSIAVGDMHALGLLDSGTVVSWGYGGVGQLGYVFAAPPPDRLVPGPVPGLTGVTAIRAGNFSSGAINPDGAWTWGWSTGVAGKEAWAVPILVDGTQGATDLSLGMHHGLFLLDGVPLDLPDPVETAMTVDVATEAVYVGEPVSFTVTADPAPDMGTIEMGADPTGTAETAEIDPATGQVTFTETFDSAGFYTRYFRFDGVPGFEPSSASIDVTVAKRPTTTTVTGPATRAIGRTQTLTFDATVVPAAAGDAQVFDVTGAPVALGDPVEVDADDGSASLTVGPLDIGTYDLEVRFLGSGSHLPSTSTNIEVTVVEGPVVGLPVVRISRGKKAGQGSVPVTVTWPTAAGGVDHHELETRVDGGPWTMVATNLKSPAVARALAVGRTHEFRARAVDSSGHVGPWIASTPFRARLTENTSSSVWYRGTWLPTTRATGYSGGSARPTRSRAARATLTFTGTGVTWLATVGPTRGRIRVYIDGAHLKTIDLRSSAIDTRRILFTKHWPTAARHTITLYNEATSGRTRVDLDAFLTWTGP